MKIDVENPQAVLEDILTRINKGELVAVVRCRDCKYCELIYDEGDNERLCNNPLGLPSINDNSYCPYGRRKEKTDGKTN